MGKRQIRSQEKHSEGRKIPYRSELLKGQDEGPGLFAWEKRRQGDGSDCFLPLMANAFDEDAKKCMEAGMNAHLTKPIEIDHVIEVLGQYCR